MNPIAWLDANAPGFRTRLYAAGSDEPGHCGQQMDEEYQQVFHGGHG